jgi:hypothetical protein
MRISAIVAGSIATDSVSQFRNVATGMPSVAKSLCDIPNRLRICHGDMTSLSDNLVRVLAVFNHMPANISSVPAIFDRSHLDGRALIASSVI